MPVKKSNILIIIFLIGGFLMTAYFGCNYTICQQYYDYSGLDLILEAVERTFSFKHLPWDIFALNSIKTAFKTIGICVLIYSLIAAWIIFEQQRRAHFKKGLECGSAHWNEDIKEYNKTYTDPIGSPKNDGSYNMILTNEVKLYMNSYVTQLNNNVTVVGGSGSGKSRSFVKPNLLEANTNYVVTDPSGELLESVGTFLESQGYTIKVFNLVEMAKSCCYNPFDYIRDELGVVMMIKCLIKNTTPPNQKSSEDFWVKSEEALLQALCFYLIEGRPKKDRNFTTIMKLLRSAEIDEHDSKAESHLDTIFKAHEKEYPNSLAVKQYKTFKMGAGKTLKSILISCSVRLTVFNLDQIAALTRSDEKYGVELEKMGEGKKALFVIIPSADSTYNFLVSMMYSQLFETLYYIAETKKANKRLDAPVRFLLDEFANIGEVPEFTKKLATMRKYDISCSIILQNLAQIKTMYKDDWQTILGNCDSFLFLGGQEYETVEYLSKELGNATITVRDSSQSFGKNTNSGKSYKQSKRELMTPDELMRLKNKECILLIRGLYPFRSKKYVYKKHPNYKLTGDADKERIYKIDHINNICLSQVEIMAEKEHEIAKKANNGNLMGDAKPLEEAAKAAGIKTADDVTVVDAKMDFINNWTPINPFLVTKEVETTPNSNSSQPSHAADWVPQSVTNNVPVVETVTEITVEPIPETTIEPVTENVAVNTSDNEEREKIIEENENSGVSPLEIEEENKNSVAETETQKEEEPEKLVSVQHEQKEETKSGNLSSVQPNESNPNSLKKESGDGNGRNINRDSRIIYVSEDIDIWSVD